MGCHGNYNDIKIKAAAPPPRAQPSLPPCLSLLKNHQQPSKTPHLSPRGNPGNNTSTQMQTKMCVCVEVGGGDISLFKPARGKRPRENNRTAVGAARSRPRSRGR